MRAVNHTPEIPSLDVSPSHVRHSEANLKYFKVKWIPHFVIFYLEATPPTAIEVSQPCLPSPCGPNSECRVVNGGPSCQCLPTYMGSPPNCRPECTMNSDCPPNQACMRERCRDPCPGSCGMNAQCTILNHVPICACFDGYTGDPFSSCTPAPVERRKDIKIKLTSQNCKIFVKLYFILRS